MATLAVALGLLVRERTLAAWIGAVMTNGTSSVRSEPGPSLWPPTSIRCVDGFYANSSIRWRAPATNAGLVDGYRVYVWPGIDTTPYTFDVAPSAGEMSFSVPADSKYYGPGPGGWTGAGISVRALKGYGTAGASTRVAGWWQLWPQGIFMYRNLGYSQCSMVGGYQYWDPNVWEPWHVPPSMD
ncbi:hypothetical protein [Nocardioides sp. YIM 152588]|uniref:hypothetical protein n=1 Tax=Nocardioides sp. YIM 152588 TaxID=3158259 RepID=UPI0032E52530